jgi:hypothetical protein
MAAGRRCAATIQRTDFYSLPDLPDGHFTVFRQPVLSNHDGSFFSESPISSSSVEHLVDGVLNADAEVEKCRCCCDEEHQERQAKAHQSNGVTKFVDPVG